MGLASHDLGRRGESLIGRGPDHRSTRARRAWPSATTVVNAWSIRREELRALVSTISYPYFRSMDRRLYTRDTGLGNGCKTSKLDSPPSDSMAW